MKHALVLSISLVLYSGMLFSCKKEEAPPVVPKLVVDNVNVDEGDSGIKKAIINVELSEKTTVAVSLKWATADGTAKAGEDYEAVTSQDLVFEPGEMYKVLEVNLIPDENMEFNDVFYVNFSGLTNATTTINQIKVTIENDDSYKPEKVADGYITPDNYPGWTLVWADEFNGTALNTSDWNYELGGGGWGNNELEVYTNSAQNSFVQDGYLTIQALKNQYNGQYTSARLTTKGKKEFTYGRIDIRAKMPVGQGLWPALWMLGGNISSVGWPLCGEIDIMEYLGHDPVTVYGTIHYGDPGHQYKGSNIKVQEAENYHDTFHVFSIIWQDGMIKWYMDYKEFFTATNSTINYSAFNLPQFFIFNVAVGGNWPGEPNASTTFPQSMVVDYVRVFQ